MRALLPFPVQLFLPRDRRGQDRRSFLKTLASLPRAGVPLRRRVPAAAPYHLDRFHVAGFQYHAARLSGEPPSRAWLRRVTAEQHLPAG